MSKATLAVCACVLLLGLGSQGFAQANAQRNAYFGETHFHTSYWIGTPLDFAGVTDHAEYVSVVRIADDPASLVRIFPNSEGG